MAAHEKVRFRERRRPLLINPGKGCATFQRFNGDPLNEGTRWSEEGPLEFPPAEKEVADRYLPCTVAYCRWFWEILEPQEGRFDWSMVERSLETARKRGQTLQVRLMPHGSVNQPQLPEWYQDKYPTALGGKKASGKYVEANYDDAEYFDTWGKVIHEFAARFDGHPDLESVDMAFIGPWGEGAGEISEAQVDRFVDLYFDVHKKTALLANTDGYQLECGIGRGAGWRCDCFGDLGFFGRKWNHTYDAYPKAVVQAGAQERWRTQPVVFETCGVPLRWKESDFDLDFILQQGYKYHCSVFMPKSNPLPEDYMEPLAEFCDRIGYRFALRQATWERKAKKGGDMEFSMWIENTGIAPVYRDYKLALRIKQDQGETVLPLDADVRTWLPGDAWIEDLLRLPESLGTGDTMLYAGLVDPEKLEPQVHFAVEEAEEDGWVPLGIVKIE